MLVRTTTLATIACATFVAGCAEQLAVSQTVANVQTAPVVPTGLVVRVEACVDRTDSAATIKRNIGEEATQALLDRLRKSSQVAIGDDTSLLLTCDVERFVEGSAFERWLMPGQGPTIGAAAVTLWDTRTQQVLLTLRSQSSVRSGGLYSIGADKVIFRAVFDDLISKLEGWSRSEFINGEARRPPPPATQTE